MCGIVGYIGEGEVKESIIKGLKLLEYRGYDSAGIALLNRNNIFIKKTPGKIKALEKELSNVKFKSSIGIGHTRWATHGLPNQINAHPHIDCKKEIVLVHNGIIENYQELKKELKRKKHKIKSDTDTEILAHLIEEYLKKNSFEEAIFKAIKKIKGQYALAAFYKKEPEKLIVAREGSPLIIGRGKNFNIVASDIPAVLPLTKKVMFLDDGEIGIITKEKIVIKNSEKNIVKKSFYDIPWDVLMAAKSGYKHFMLKEIFEQPAAIEKTIRFCLSNGNLEIFKNKKIKKALKDIEKIYLIACGTSYHACLIAKYWIEMISKINVEVDIASEFRYREPVFSKKSILATVSQSGETADTLAAMRLAKNNKIATLTITNVVGSTLARESDFALFTQAGPEIGVASTKAFTTQLVILFLLAIELGLLKKNLTGKEYMNYLGELKNIPDKIQLILDNIKEIEDLGYKYFKFRNFLYLGRNFNYPIALEGALKLKEISYIHAEGYAAGEMKHGPIALIDEKMPIFVIAVEDNNIIDKIVSNIEEVKARKGIIISIITSRHSMIKKLSNDVIVIPETINCLYPFLTVIPAQLLAYDIAVRLGCDVDQPRNLAKSVTVE